jgi:hypothetical protein
MAATGRNGGAVNGSSFSHDAEKNAEPIPGVSEAAIRASSVLPEHLLLKDSHDADEALKAFASYQGEVIHVDEETNRRLLRKIDWNIMPVSWFVKRRGACSFYDGDVPEREEKEGVWCFVLPDLNAHCRQHFVGDFVGDFVTWLIMGLADVYHIWTELLGQDNTELCFCHGHLGPQGEWGNWLARGSV